MALVKVKKENRVLSIEESELERYLEQGYEQVTYDHRSNDYKSVQKKTVNDTEFSAELGGMSAQAAKRDAANPLTNVEFGSEISPAEAAKLGATPADVARAAGVDAPHVDKMGNVAAHDAEFASELTAGAAATAAGAAAANAEATAPNADYSGEFASEVAPNATTEATEGAAAKAARKRKQ